MQSKAGGVPLHRALSTFTALHVTALYITYIGSLSSFHHILQPHSAQEYLQPLGLWYPSSEAAAAPLLLLLAASLHAAIGRQIAASHSTSVSTTDRNTTADIGAIEGEVVEESCAVPAVGGVPTWHAASLIWFARGFVVKYGSAGIALLAYALVLKDCDLGLIGAVYLGMLVLILAVVPPARGKWCIAQVNRVEERMHQYQQQEAEEEISQPLLQQQQQQEESDSARRIEPEDRLVYRFILGPTHSASEERKLGPNEAVLQLHGTCIWSWLPLCCLSLLAVIDFGAQLILPALATSFSEGSISWKLPEDVLDFLKTVIGTSCLLLLLVLFLHFY